MSVCKGSLRILAPPPAGRSGVGRAWGFDGSRRAGRAGRGGASTFYAQLVLASPVLYTFTSFHVRQGEDMDGGQGHEQGTVDRATFLRQFVSAPYRYEDGPS